MARPQKQTVEYFSHDADASNGRTLSVLFNHFGHEGISAWWLLLERLSRSRNHVISINNGVNTEFLASTMHFTPARLKEILAKMADLQAIDPPLFARGIIWCQNFVDRLEPVYKYRKQQLPIKPELSIPETELSIPETELLGGDSTPPPSSNVKPSLCPPPVRERESIPPVRERVRENKKPPQQQQSFDDFKNSLKSQYPGLDVDKEWEGCLIWWSEGKKQMTRPKTALRNWLNIARDRKVKQEGQGNGTRKISHVYEDMTGKGPD